MTIKNKIKTLGQMSQRFKRNAEATAMRFASIHFLIKNRRAISPVISNLIIVAVVIVLGFSVLAYARSTSMNYQTQYQQNVSSDVDKLKELLAFEYVSYGSGNLYIYFMNAGNINVNIDKVYLSTSSNNVIYTISNMDGSSAPNHSLAVGDERLVIVQQALASGSYSVKITTIRGSSFAYSFVV